MATQPEHRRVNKRFDKMGTALTLSAMVTLAGAVARTGGPVKIAACNLCAAKRACNPET
jgi:hypothetical protein